MTKILIVEDNAAEQKTREIVNILKNLRLNDYEIKNTQKCALRYLTQNNIDILITDIQLPVSLDSETIEEDGGQNLISRILKLNHRIRVPKLIIGVTSYDDSVPLCKDFFEENGFSLMLTHEIQKKLNTILKNYIIQNKEDVDSEIDVLIITALRHIELESVKALKIDWEGRSYQLGPSIYWKGIYSNSNGVTRTILATSCYRMGCVASATTTTMFLNHFKPKLVAMTGITAGVKGRVSLGDIVVADATWEYESGKRTIEKKVQKFMPSNYRLNMPQRMKSNIQEISFQKDLFESIHKSCTVVGKPSKPPELKIGPMVSGSSVIEDESIVASIISQQERKVIAIEMEAFGVAFACDSSEQQPSYLIVKSVCDFANIEKNDIMQEYAAYTSSEFAFKYIQEYI
ncbi:hypothetical protein [Thalassolituus oleivorans]|uniref:phosphorylase family protein n=1 Tax=Thalassolituus oleivorans TaxID=187493 RepID=UPI001CE36D73|nr:hypothetical protein [Thalassolituus oleivorans]MCA6128738.1 hypothetical protein [Thalassolituus oleivorans 4BN06-13]